MNAALQPLEWSPTSWTSRPAQQQPSYRDPVALARAVEALGRLPPIVVSWEIESLKQQIADAQRGERFLLQGGDCAESFADCDSGQIARKLKILLQMSLVLLHGLKKPVVRIGRFAGQYAKPRSTDTETRDGRDPAVLPRRPGQPPWVYGRGARARSGTAAARLRTRGAHAELHPRADRWRVRRPAPSGILGPGIRQAFTVARPVPADRKFHCRRARFLRGDERQSRARGKPGAVLCEPRSPAPALRAGANALHRAPGPLVQPLDAPAVDRHAYGGSRRSPRGVLPRHLEPGRSQGRALDGCGLGPGPVSRAQPGQRTGSTGADPSHGCANMSRASCRR